MWAEVGRLQVHGYEMRAIAASARAPLRAFTAGDEKVIRVFDAPRFFSRALATLCGSALAAEGRPLPEESDGAVPEFGYVPELGLTNKGVTLDGCGAPIRDRFQVDGRDAMRPQYDASATAARTVNGEAPNILCSVSNIV